MKIIKIPLFIILFLLLFFLESFFLKLFSFSIFIILVLSFWRNGRDIYYYLFLSLFGLVLDSVTHTPLGVHIFVLSVLLLLLELSWLLISREGKYRVIPMFLFIFLYYTLTPVFSSLFTDFVFPDVSIFSWGNIVLNSVISVGFSLLIERFTKSLRSENSRGDIRLM